MSDPFETFLNVELPRRPVTLTLALTGWDAPPTDPGAPGVVKDAPIGTWFREHTAAKWWRKHEVIWVESTGGGPGGDGTVKASATDTTPGYLDAKLEAGPGISLTKLRVAANEAYKISSKTITTEPISMVVDPATGVSPPAGTQVSTQAEYDALGAPLRYAQDALRILPPVLGDYVKIRLVAGEHWAAAGSVRLLWAIGRPVKVADGALTAIDPVLGSVIRGQIHFYGDTSVYTASQSGTYSAPRTITCPTGTWVVNELRGKYVWFLTGTGAGQRLPIRGNTATTIEMGTTISGGSGTFEVRQNDSWLIPTTTGSDTLGLTIQNFSGSALQGSLLFYYLNINKPSKTANIYTSFGTYTSFFRCNLHLEGVGTYGANFLGRAILSYSQIVVAGPYPVWCGGAEGFETGVQYSMVRGKYAATGAGYIGLFTTYSGGVFSATDSVFEPTDGTFLKALIGAEQGTVYLRFGCVLDGLGTAQGLSLGGAGESNAAFYSEGSVTITNCATAIVAGIGSAVASGATVAGAGNTTVFSVSGGAQVRWRRTALSITGTNWASVDGETFSSSILANDGDEIIGQYGSLLAVTA